MTLLGPQNSLSYPLPVTITSVCRGNLLSFMVIVFLHFSFNLTTCIFFKNMDFIWIELHCIFNNLLFSFNIMFIGLIHVIVYICISFSLLYSITLCGYTTVYWFIVVWHLVCFQFGAIIMVLLWTFFYVCRNTLRCESLEYFWATGNAYFQLD